MRTLLSTIVSSNPIGHLALSIIKGLVIFLPYSVAAQNDCIFNNDIEGLTADWIERSNTGYYFKWDEGVKSYRAQISRKESIEVSSGGCIHFTTSLNYSTSERKDLNDVDFWISKALELAEMFQIEFFLQPLRSRAYSLEQRGDKHVIYSFPVEEFSNKSTEGILIEQKGNTIVLEMSYYIN